MPRIVDHTQRRARIVDGLIRVAARDGLHAVTMRSVATEAAVSLRLVQYYFHTKSELIRAALRHLEHQSQQRWAARLARLPERVSARSFVEEFLAEALPTDDTSRVFHLVATSYAVLAMTDPELADHPFVAGLSHLEQQLADVIAHARTHGALSAECDPSTEAACLVALSHGIGTTVLVGHRTPQEATDILRYHLDRLFGSSRRC